MRFHQVGTRTEIRTARFALLRKIANTMPIQSSSDFFLRPTSKYNNNNMSETKREKREHQPVLRSHLPTTSKYYTIDIVFSCYSSFFSEQSLYNGNILISKYFGNALTFELYFRFSGNLTRTALCV